jgi:hypothetical protein
MVMWLRERGCPWHTHTLLAAVMGGQADATMLQWMLAEGCPTNKSPECGWDHARDWLIRNIDPS